MDVYDKLSVIISTAVAVVMAYLYWREYRLKKEKAPSEQAANVADAVKNLSDALGLTSNELVESLTEAAKLRDELKREKENTIKRINETAQHRAEMEEKIRQLNLHIEGLNRDYLKEMQSVRDENAALKKQVDDIEGKYKNSKEIIELLLMTLNDNNIVDLPPKLLTLLGDSIKGWKWPQGRKP